MLLIALALAQAAPFDVKGNYIEMAKEHCRREWPDNFSMQSYCLKREAEGMIAFKRVNDELGKPLERALEKCTKEWTKDRLPDWSMIAYCAKRQAEGYREVNSPPSP